MNDSVLPGLDKCMIDGLYRGGELMIDHSGFEQY